MQCTSLVIPIVTKINQVPYQMIEYNDNGMFTVNLMNDTPIEIFIDNGVTPPILPLCTYNKFPILHTYPKTKSNTPIHTGGGLITSHFWLEIPLKLQDYAAHKLYLQQILIPLTVRNNIRILPGKTGVVALTL